MLLASCLSPVQVGLRFTTSDKVDFMDDHDKASIVAKPVARLTASTRAQCQAGMELVRNLRAHTHLLPPPAPQE